MRQIKFRAWEEKNKQMYPNEQVYKIQDSWCADRLNELGDTMYSTEDIELMQFTGLTDKNGKKIYEGDIVSVGQYYCGDTLYPSFNGVVLYDDGGYFVSGNKPKDSHELDSVSIHNLDIEVIGNIHQNKNLLDK